MTILNFFVISKICLLPVNVLLYIRVVLTEQGVKFIFKSHKYPVNNHKEEEINYKLFKAKHVFGANSRFLA